MFDRNSPFTAKTPDLDPRPKTELAEDVLTEAILWCELLPGSTATEVELADRFGLGRAATRVALAKLSVLGLVQPIPRLGWRIQPMSGAQIGQVISARRLTEPALAETELDRQTLKRLDNLATMIAAINDQTDSGALSSRRGYEREFLNLVLSGLNPMIAGFLSTLWDLSDRITRFLELGGAEPMPAMDALSLSAALANKDRAEAVRTINKHLDTFELFASKGLLRDSSELVLEGDSTARQTEKPEQQKRDTSTVQPTVSAPTQSSITEKQS
nr:GntR family transcriptional regulator [uncultured Cohaesibacter sp.]